MVQPLLDAVVKVGVGARAISDGVGVPVEDPLPGETIAEEHAVGKHRQSNATKASRGALINQMERTSPFALMAATHLFGSLLVIRSCPSCSVPTSYSLSTPLMWRYTHYT